MLRRRGLTLKFYDSHADVLLLAIPNVVPDHYKVRRAACPHLSCYAGTAARWEVTDPRLYVSVLANEQVTDMPSLST